MIQLGVDLSLSLTAVEPHQLPIDIAPDRSIWSVNESFNQIAEANIVSEVLLVNDNFCDVGCVHSKAWSSLVVSHYDFALVR